MKKGSLLQYRALLRGSQPSNRLARGLALGIVLALFATSAGGVIFGGPCKGCSFSAGVAICILDESLGAWANCEARTRCITTPNGETQCFEMCRLWGICYIV